MVPRFRAAWSAVRCAAQSFGRLHPSRLSKGFRAHVSACSIVAEVLANLKINLSEDSVENAWKEYRRYTKERLSSENL